MKKMLLLSVMVIFILTGCFADSVKLDEEAVHTLKLNAKKEVVKDFFASLDTYEDLQDSELVYEEFDNELKVKYLNYQLSDGDYVISNVTESEDNEDILIVDVWVLEENIVEGTKTVYDSELDDLYTQVKILEEGEGIGKISGYLTVNYNEPGQANSSEEKEETAMFSYTFSNLVKGDADGVFISLGRGSTNTDASVYVGKAEVGELYDVSGKINSIDISYFKYYNKGESYKKYQFVIECHFLDSDECKQRYPGMSEEAIGQMTIAERYKVMIKTMERSEMEE